MQIQSIRSQGLFCFAFLTIIAIALFFGTGCNSIGTDASNNVSIRLKWLNQAQFAGFYCADREGLYKKEGLNIVLHPGGLDFPAVKMVASGADTFGVAGAEQLLLAREKNIPVVAVAVIYKRSPLVLFVLKETGIDSPKQFAGKTAGVKYGDSEELMYRALLNAAHVDASKVKEFPAKFDLTPLLTKKVDIWTGYVINEPIACEEHGRPVNLIWPHKYGISFYGDTMFTTEEMIKNHPDVVRKVVQATMQGWADALKDQKKAVEYTLASSSGLKLRHEARMMAASVQLVKPDDKPLGYMDAKVWNSMQALLIKQGFMKNPTDVSKAFTNEFLK